MTLLGYGIAVTCQFSFFLGNLSLKKLDRISTFQVFYLFQILMIATTYFLIQRKRLTLLPTSPKLTKTLLVRCLISIISSCLFYIGIRQISMSTVTILQMTGPVFAAFFSTLLLKEIFDITMGTTTFLSILGVIFITKPTFLFGSIDLGDDIDPHAQFIGSMLILGACVLNGLIAVMSKKISGRVDPLVVVFYLAF